MAMLLYLFITLVTMLILGGALMAPVCEDDGDIE